MSDILAFIQFLIGNADWIKKNFLLSIILILGFITILIISILWKIKNKEYKKEPKEESIESKFKVFAENMDDDTYAILYTFYETEQNVVSFRNLTEYLARNSYAYLGCGHKFVFRFVDRTRFDILEKEGFIKRPETQETHDIEYIIDFRLKKSLYKICKKRKEPKQRLVNVANEPTISDKFLQQQAEKEQSKKPPTSITGISTLNPIEYDDEDL